MASPNKNGNAKWGKGLTSVVDRGYGVESTNASLLGKEGEEQDSAARDSNSNHHNNIRGGIILPCVSLDTAFYIFIYICIGNNHNKLIIL